MTAKYRKKTKQTENPKYYDFNIARFKSNKQLKDIKELRKTIQLFFFSFCKFRTKYLLIICLTEYKMSINRIRAEK